MNLAIKGHPKRGNEVIGRLEMLGGVNGLDLKGTEADSPYYIDNSINEIYCGFNIYLYDYKIYSLEEFEEKFPYKIGNKVLYKSNNTPYFIRKMFWENDKVLYELSDEIYSCGSSLPDTIIFDVDVEKLQPYKEENYCQVIGNDTLSEGINTSASLRDEETMEERDKAVAPNLVGNDYSGKRFGYIIPQGYEFDCIQNNEIIIKPIKPQYPKTYKECFNICFGNKHHLVQVVGLNGLGDNKELFESFIKLKICRDAYWKIAGEQMGLGKDWEPDWNDRCFIIANNDGNIHTYEYHGSNNVILAFPTEEMRDAFKENFDPDIEVCKELL